MASKGQFLAIWLLVLGGVAGLNFFLAWSISQSYGLYRSGILVYFTGTIGGLLILGYLHDQYEEGHGDYNWRNHWLMPRFMSIWYVLKGLRDIQGIDRPWGMAVALGIILGSQFYGGLIVAPGLAAPNTAPGLVGQPLPGLPLPLVTGGEFDFEDLEGSRTLLLYMRRFGGPGPGFISAWDTVVDGKETPVRFAVVIFDQYGDVEPYREVLTPDSTAMRYPTMVARKWLRERLGNYKGKALLLLVSEDGTIEEVWEEEDIVKDRRQAIIDRFLGGFAD